MKLSEFEFDLPEKLIAEYPADQRDESSSRSYAFELKRHTHGSDHHTANLRPVESISFPTQSLTPHED